MGELEGAGSVFEGLAGIEVCMEGLRVFVD